MAEKELRRMSRTELIEIIYALKTREGQLMQENEELKEKLAQRNIKMDAAGSIAEAALSLNHIFEDAQQAAEDYISSIKEMITQRYGEMPAPEEKENPPSSDSDREEQQADEAKEE